MVLLMLPEFFFALFEKNGMHLETILTNFINVRFKRPAVRRYEIENLYEYEPEKPVTPKVKKQAATAANTLAEKAKAAVQEIVVQNKTLWAGLGIAALMLMLIMGAFSSCSAAIQGTGSTFIGTTYPSKDADMKGAEEDYLELEKKLDEQIRQMPSALMRPPVQSWKSGTRK